MDDFSEDLIENLVEMSKDYFSVYPRIVPMIVESPMGITFLRNSVSRNFPLLIKGAVTHWPALRRWNLDYLNYTLEESNVSVAITPNGFFDAIHDGRLVLPEEKIMKFPEFSEALFNPGPSVYNIQRQNNNFCEEFLPLASDIENGLPWASEAFGCTPDAVNFWMGDDRALSPLHKDEYESIYCVVRGRRDIILHSPVDVPWIPFQVYSVGRFYNSDEGVFVRNLDLSAKWTPLNAFDPDLTAYPNYKYAHQFHVTVEEGDVLYIPSMWMHQVAQSHGSIAVNFWYIMDLDAKFSNYNFFQRIGKRIREHN